MTKTSLADDAYDALLSVRQDGESFSELARRAAKELARRHLFDRSRKPVWTQPDADPFLRTTHAERDLTRTPRKGTTS